MMAASRPVMPSRHTFTNYSPTWPSVFDQEAKRLRSLLGDELITVHHSGIGIAGIAINLFAGAMHFLRSVGVYIGDARLMLDRVFERKASFVSHVCSTCVDSQSIRR
jgi:hypothetical protein